MRATTGPEKWPERRESGEAKKTKLVVSTKSGDDNLENFVEYRFLIGHICGCVRKKMVKIPPSINRNDRRTKSPAEKMTSLKS